MMRKALLMASLVLIFVSCHKEEGLTRTTGNLEVTGERKPMGCEIYTETEYLRYLRTHVGTPLYEGSLSQGKYVVKGIPEGNYGVRLFHEGKAWEKIIYVISGKVNKLSF